MKTCKLNIHCWTVIISIMSFIALIGCSSNDVDAADTTLTGNAVSGDVHPNGINVTKDARDESNDDDDMYAAIAEAAHQMRISQMSDTVAKIINSDSGYSLVMYDSENIKYLLYISDNPNRHLQTFYFRMIDQVGRIISSDSDVLVKNVCRHFISGEYTREQIRRHNDGWIVTYETEQPLFGCQITIRVSEGKGMIYYGH